ncbi:tyrosine-type recombinase/integrase [uncultured Phocaeicola sp.]|uniref:tyrosine-type recombinase/integrase n=1 Tax=uncultured Phocaeicola sp. TaxID=990718 RepID=UPI00339D9100
MIYCAIIAFFLCFVFIFYISRHTWASIARENGVSLSVISEGMGHTSEKTTRIYLASLNQVIMDEANRKVLSSIK